MATGGAIASYLQVDTGSTLVVKGTGLSLVDVGPFFSGEQYLISGKLLSGESINIDAYAYSGGTFQVLNVPEPVTYALMLAGAVLIGLQRTSGARNPRSFDRREPRFKP